MLRPGTGRDARPPTACDRTRARRALDAAEFSRRLDRVLLQRAWKVCGTFARAVSRDDLRQGAEEIGLPLAEHAAHVVAFLRERADALGLRGTL